MSQTQRSARMETVLRAAFAPVEIKVEDDSAKHAGHSHAAPEGQTHYTVTIVSEKFRGLTRLARSREVYSALSEEFQGGLHALALILRSPDEILTGK
jgi:BolA protein